MKKIKAWYFCQDREAHGDKRPIKVGITHSYDGAPRLCHRGVHASIKPLDALNYGHGDICYQVELSGDMDVGDDKICAQHRTYLRRIDCADLLLEFARWCALQVAHLIKSDQKDLIIRYLETGDESIRTAARDAAWAARDAARDARDAAWAARDAARDARAAWAVGAARAAWDDALAGQRAAALAGQRAAQNKKLEQMLMERINKVGVGE